MLNRIIFADPFVNGDVQEGQIVIVGPLEGQNYFRLKIQTIRPGKDFTADLTLVDEAPEIHGT